MSLPATNDVEAQMAGRDNNVKTARYFPRRKRSHASDLLEKLHDMRPKNWTHLSDRAGQCCFLCLKGNETGQYAVQVYCVRPTRSRPVKLRRESHEEDGSRRSVVIYKEIGPKEKACESDVAIYQRLKETCYQYQGMWKRWLPFYGITNVREVKVSFITVTISHEF